MSGFHPGEGKGGARTALLYENIIFWKLVRNDFHETKTLQLWFVGGGRLYNCVLREKNRVLGTWCCGRRTQDLGLGPKISGLRAAFTEPGRLVAVYIISHLTSKNAPLLPFPVFLGAAGMKVAV
jgi:hypothetical protein